MFICLIIGTVIDMGNKTDVSDPNMLDVPSIIQVHPINDVQTNRGEPLAHKTVPDTVIQKEKVAR